MPRLTMTDEELDALKKGLGTVKIGDPGLDLRDHALLLGLYSRVFALQTRSEARRKKGGKTDATT